MTVTLCLRPVTVVNIRLNLGEHQRKELRQMNTAAPTDERLLIPGPEARYKLGGIGWTKFCELMKSGELERVTIGRRSFVTAASLYAYVERLRGAKAGS
jgi:hypothetical protein